MGWIPAKTIVTRSKSTGWFGGEYNMNLYRGCCHGCIYCDSRSDCYGIDKFDRVRAKENALEIVRNDLRRKAKTGVVMTGAMSDPYNPFEKDLELTRHALELVSAYGFGVGVATKSELILRDIDIFREIKEESPVLLKITITTADDALSQLIEPGAPASSRRFEVVRELSEAGLFTGVLLMPVLPFLEDSLENVLSIVEQAAESGARFIYPAFGMTLRQGQREHYYQKLDKLFPGLSEQYRRRFGSRYWCGSPQAEKLWNPFSAACDSRGILYRMPEIIRAYRMGYGDRQLKLF